MWNSCDLVGVEGWYSVIGLHLTYDLFRFLFIVLFAAGVRFETSVFIFRSHRMLKIIRHPEDDSCDVFRNVGQVSAFNAVQTRKSEVPHYVYSVSFRCHLYTPLSLLWVYLHVILTWRIDSSRHVGHMVGLNKFHWPVGYLTCRRIRFELRALLLR
jgi:hypothetical protein